jgi:hypothetical protein
MAEVWPSTSVRWNVSDPIYNHRTIVKKPLQRFSKLIESGSQTLIPNFENVVNVQHKETQVIPQYLEYYLTAHSHRCR